MQADKMELLDPEWMDLLLEALDMDMSSQEVSKFLQQANQSS